MSNFKKSGVIIQGFNVIDVTRYIGKLSKRYQATLLGELEDIYSDDADTESHSLMRKAVLDNFNDFTRNIIEAIFGDIENA